MKNEEEERQGSRASSGQAERRERVELTHRGEGERDFVRGSVSGFAGLMVEDGEGEGSALFCPASGSGFWGMRKKTENGRWRGLAITCKGRGVT